MSDDYGFENKTVDELRKIVTDLVNDNMDLAHTKKEYVAGINSVVKENNKKIEAAMESIKTRSANDAALELEKKADAILQKNGL